MVDFAANIYGMQGQITYDPTPTLASGALAVKQSSYTGPYIRTISGLVNSWDIGLPYVAAADVPVGTKWLFLYSCSFGGTTVSDKPQAYFTQVGRDLGMGIAEGNSHGDPEYMRASHLGGFSVFTSNGENVGFILRSFVGGGSPNYFGGINLVGVPLDNLTEDTDYFEAHHATLDEDSTTGLSDSSNAGSYFDLVTKTFTVPETGAYVVMACTTGKASTALSDIRARLVESTTSGDSILETQHKENRDAADHQPFEFLEIQNLTAGQSVTYKLQGLSNLLPSYTYYQPRIFVLRLGAFRSSSYNGTSNLPVSVAVSHPAYQEVVSTNFSPYQTSEGEYALVLGKCIGYRTNSAATVARLRDKWSGEPFHRFCATANISGNDVDRPSLFCFAAPLINFARDYALEASGEGGYTTLPYAHSGRIAVIGLTPASAPAGNTIYLTLGDTTPQLATSDGSATGGTGGTQVYATLDDETPGQNSFDMTSVTVTPAQTQSIPVAHPRLWIYNNDRVAYWQSRAVDGNRPWDMLKTDRARRNAFANVMAYLASGTESYLTTAITQIDAELANASSSWPSTEGSIFQSNGVNIRDYARNMALCYDWLYDNAALGETRKRKMEDYLMCLAMVHLNPESAFCVNNFPVGYNNITDYASSNTQNNHYVSSTLTMTYVALALKHHQPASVGFPLGTTDPTKRVEFELPRYWDQADGGGAYFSDPYEFLEDRLSVAIPAWEPKADGGGWHEGLNYGRGAMRNMHEVFLLMRDTAGLDYLSTTLGTSLGEAGIHWISYYQPGVQKLYCSGDNTTNNSTWANDFDRMVLLFHAEAYRGTDSGRYAQYFLTNDRPYMGNGDGSGGESDMQCMDFFYYRHDAPSTLYSSILPTTRYTPGIGYFSSRNQWGTSATNFTLSSQEQIQGHMHEDQNSLQIFKGGSGANTAKEGWLLCEIMMSEANGTGGASHSAQHSTYVVYDETTLGSSGWTQRGNFSPGNNGLGPVGEIARQYADSSVYSYALGACDDAYWQTTNNVTGSQVVNQINTCSSGSLST